MAILELRVTGYRSIRDLTLPMQRLNVITGGNGTGKTNLYRAMYILAMAADGRLAHCLAEEGGMPSILWAGERTADTTRVKISVATDQLAYTLVCGPPPGSRSSLFYLDPEVLEESITWVEGGERVDLLQRKGTDVWTLDDEGGWISYPVPLEPSESILAQISEPHRYPHLSAVRMEFLNWRFYHHFRVDAESPIRQPQIGVRTSVLTHDGRDLAAAVQTIFEIGDGPRLRQAVSEAFPGGILRVDGPEARFRLALQMPSFNRPFSAQELSDGTLRYLCLAASLLSPRPPSVLALNEPETHLHPDLLKPLAKLIVDSSADSQLWVTTHAAPLADEIKRLGKCDLVALEKRGGETRIVGKSPVKLKK